jgi:hypothetical protein
VSAGASEDASVSEEELKMFRMLWNSGTRLHFNTLHDRHAYVDDVLLSTTSSAKHDFLLTVHFGSYSASLAEY